MIWVVIGLVNLGPKVYRGIEDYLYLDSMETKSTVSREISTGTLDIQEFAEMVITVPVQIGYHGYDRKWEYLEYGSTVEYFHPEGTNVSFWFEYNGQDYSKSVELFPPQMRALVNAFPEYVTYYKEGYFVNVTLTTHSDDSVVINWVENNTGSIVWTPEMEKAPRELNALESWSMEYAESSDSTYYMEKFFDTLPDCNSCDWVLWSPAEEHARYLAFKTYVTNPENNVWVEIWGAVDPRYRWVDAETGKVLQKIDRDADLWALPESGWLALQVGKTGNGTYENPELWETTYTVKMEPAFVVGIDQDARLNSTGPLQWIFTEASMAYRTEKWEEDKILNLLQFSE